MRRAPRTTGRVELRVGEPPRRGLRRRRDPDGEAWLRDHGFTAIPDAWALPVPAATSDAQCAATLEAALAGGLQVEPDAPARARPDPPGIARGARRAASRRTDRSALRGGVPRVALLREGRFHIDSGRPGALRAWVWVDGEELLVEREVPGVEESPGESWREPLEPEGADAAAAELARRERADRPSADSEPWLLGYIAPE